MSLNPDSIQRVVSLVPSLTETLFELGVGGKVVGITDYCIKPRHKLNDLPRIGGPLDPSVDRIAALQPHLVLANREENSLEALNELKRCRIKVHIEHVSSVSDVISELTYLGTLLGVEKRATTIIDGIRNELNRTGVSRFKDNSPRILCLLWKDPWIAVGPNTYISDIFTVCGATNAIPKGYKPEERYPRLTLHEITDINPDIILLPTEPYHFTQDDARWWLNQREILAAQKQRVINIAGDYICWHGAATVHGIGLLNALLWQLDSTF